MIAASQTDAPPITGLPLLIAGVALNCATAYGIWKMKKWGYWLVIFGQVALVFGPNLLEFLGSLGSASRNVLPQIVILVISASITYWFYTHRHLFELSASDE